MLRFSMGSDLPHDKPTSRLRTPWSNVRLRFALVSERRRIESHKTPQRALHKGEARAA